jgi:hypothetical protein
MIFQIKTEPAVYMLRSSTSLKTKTSVWAAISAKDERQESNRNETLRKIKTRYAHNLWITDTDTYTGHDTDTDTPT